LFECEGAPKKTGTLSEEIGGVEKFLPLWHKVLRGNNALYEINAFYEFYAINEINAIYAVRNCPGMLEVA
jgi:hypothetical protein